MAPMDGDNMINRIEIDFPVMVKPTDEFFRQLSALVDTMCKQFEIDNPGEKMRLGNCGPKLMSKSCLGESPEFDETIYHMDVCNIDC